MPAGRREPVNLVLAVSEGCSQGSISQERVLACKGFWDCRGNSVRRELTFYGLSAVDLRSLRRKYRYIVYDRYSYANFAISHPLVHLKQSLGSQRVTDTSTDSLCTCTAYTLSRAPPQVRDPGANEDVVRRVCDMGFPEAQARRALAASDWDEMAAINALLSGS